MYDHRHVISIVGRTPVLSAAIAESLLHADDLASIIRHVVLSNRELVLGGLSVASPSIHDALLKWLGGAQATKKLLIRTYAYLLRMSTRCTPFGLFASIGAIDVGQTTSLRLDPQSLTSHSRPDMAWLLALIRELEGDDALATSLSYQTNGYIRRRGDRYYVTNYDPTRGQHKNGVSLEYDETSLRVTDVLDTIMELAHNGIDARTLIEAVGNIRSASENEIVRLLQRLCEVGVLVSSLRPSLLARPIDRLIAALPQGSESRLFLQTMCDELETIDRLKPNARFSDCYDCVIAACQQLMPAKEVIQVDLTIGFTGSLGKDVLDDAGRLVTYWMQSTPEYTLAAYRNKFIERFESIDKRVPLLDLVDHSRGIGSPPQLPEATFDFPTSRVQAINSLMVKAMRNRTHVLSLTEAELAECLGPLPTDAELPRSFEIGIEVAAESRELVASGDYTIGPAAMNLSYGAGRSAGRFSHLLESGRHELEIDLDNSKETAIDVELVFMPGVDRYANVCVTTSKATHEILFGVSPEGSKVTIPIDDIVVGIVANRFVVWSQSLGRELRITQNHLLNSQKYAPDACRFLSLLETEANRFPVGFFWGRNLQDAPMKPRLQVGNLIVSLATWTMPKAILFGDRDEVSRRIAAWREDLNVPEVVCITDGVDLRLPISLDSTCGIELLISEGEKSVVDTVSFVEMYPNNRDYWLESGSDRHKSELIVSFQNRTVRKMVPFISEPLPDDQQSNAAFNYAYLKIYCHNSVMDELLIRRLAPAVEALRSKLSHFDWFFVRYADPLPHLRVRLLASHSADAGRAREMLIELGASMLADKSIESYSLHSYVREFERYGGQLHYRHIETLFSLSSATALESLRAIGSNYDERVRQTILGFDGLLRGLLSPEELKTFIKLKQRTNRRLTEAERLSSRLLQTALLSKTPIERSHSSVAYFQRDDVRRSMTRSLPDVLTSLLHMHCNRMGIPPGRSEELLRDLVSSVYYAVIQRESQNDQRREAGSVGKMSHA